MDRPLQVGDLVFVSGDHHGCHAKYLGRIRTMEEVRPIVRLQCCNCGRIVMTSAAYLDDKDLYPLSCLTRIPPLEELEHESTDIGIPIAVR